jgi:acetyltransferase-like isoleucine patch superfamily enzyme
MLRVLWWLAKGYWYKWTYRVRGIQFEAGRNFRVQGRFVVRGPGRVVFGDNVLVGVGRTTPWTHAADAIIKIGDNTILNGTRFGAARLIDVGADCLLAEAEILDTDFHSLRADRRRPGVPVRVDPVIIAENVWIGASTGILPGTTIGRNSVVGFGSVCTGAYPADSLIAGNRARVIKPLPTPDTNARNCPSQSARPCWSPVLR